MKIKCKHFKKIVNFALVAVVATAQILSSTLVAKAADPIILAPENMVQFEIVDQDGNAVDGVGYTITNSSGARVATFSTSGQCTPSYGSGIKSEDTFIKWKEDFELLVAPAKMDTTNGGIHYEEIRNGTTIYVTSNALELSSGQEMNVTLYTMPVKEIALTVPANTIMVNADSQWANGATKHIITANGQDYVINNMAGTLTSVPMPADGNIALSFYYGYNPFTDEQQRSTASDYSMSTEQTEYIKVRMKVEDIAWDQYNDKGVYIHDGKEIAIASGQADPGESALWIISGSVINMPVPDANGYIEFYVENTEREYEYETNHSGWSPTMAWGGGDTHGSGRVTEPVDMTVRAVDFPTDKSYMTYVPADTYTINVTKVPDGYEIPEPITFTVQNSQQFQTAKIVLESSHTHSYGTEYKTDVNYHWNVCACGTKGNISAHTPGPAATEESAQTCTVCGYEIAPRLEHVHSYGTTYSSDANNHWNVCACGTKGNISAHTPGPAATEESAQTCTVCGYEIAPRLEHVHSYGTTYSSDANNHWNVCACGTKGNISAHTPGPVATESSAQTCTVCGYVIAPALGHQHSYGTTYSSDADSHWNTCVCGATGNEADHSFQWVTDKPATETAAGSKHEECTVCGYEKTAVEIPKLESDDEDEDEDDDEEYVAPVQGDVKDDVPKTGDSFTMTAVVWGSIALLSGAALIVFNKKRVNGR